MGRIMAKKLFFAIFLFSSIFLQSCSNKNGYKDDFNDWTIVEKGKPISQIKKCSEKSAGDQHAKDAGYCGSFSLGIAEFIKEAAANIIRDVDEYKGFIFYPKYYYDRDFYSVQVLDNVVLYAFDSTRGPDRYVSQIDGTVIMILRIDNRSYIENQRLNMEEYVYLFQGLKSYKNSEGISRQAFVFRPIPAKSLK